MKKSTLSIVIFFLMATSILQGQDAQSIINSTIEAMGGLDKWKNIEYIKMNHAGHKHWLEQSENPNGPFITSYEVVEEVRAVWKDQLSRKQSSHFFQARGETKNEFLINGDRGVMKFGQRSFPIAGSFKVNYYEWMRYAPERLVFDALKAPLTREKDEVIEGTNHWAVSYLKEGLKHTLYINPTTHLVYQAVIDTFLPTDVYHYPWGKFKTTVIYSIYWLYPDDIRYPAQWTILKLGKPYGSITIFDIDFRPEISADFFKIPDNIPDPRPSTPLDEFQLKTEDIVEVAENIFSIPGSWNVGHIVQSDGIWIIEGPISSNYNAQHIEYLKKKYPNKPIKGSFVTSDAWPHIGGAREFGANKIPIYTHRLNEQILKSLFASDHSIKPDSYEKSRQKPNVKLISTPQKINDSLNPFEIIPINGEGGERMIMLYFPNQKVLYASDLIQFSDQTKTALFSPQYQSEIKSAIERHHMNVEKVFAFHIDEPIAYAEIIKSLESVK